MQPGTVAWLKPRLGLPRGGSHLPGCRDRAHIAKGRENIRPQHSHTLAASVSLKLAQREDGFVKCHLGQAARLLIVQASPKSTTASHIVGAGNPNNKISEKTTCSISFLSR